MPGPAPAYQPTFTEEEIAQCQRLVRQHTAPQVQVYRAKLALLLHDHPALDNVSAGKQLGKLRALGALVAADLGQERLPPH